MGKLTLKSINNKHAFIYMLSFKFKLSPTALDPFSRKIPSTHSCMLSKKEK